MVVRNLRKPAGGDTGGTCSLGQLQLSSDPRAVHLPPLIPLPVIFLQTAMQSPSADPQRPCRRGEFASPLAPPSAATIPSGGVLQTMARVVHAGIGARDCRCAQVHAFPEGALRGKGRGVRVREGRNAFLYCSTVYCSTFSRSVPLLHCIHISSLSERLFSLQPTPKCYVRRVFGTNR